jgi:hypothetical protein
MKRSLVVIMLLLAASCATKPPFSVASHEGLEIVSLHEATISYYGDYEFVPVRGENPRKWRKTYFAHLDKQWRYVGGGSTFIEPYFKTMIFNRELEHAINPTSWRTELANQGAESVVLDSLSNKVYTLRYIQKINGHYAFFSEGLFSTNKHQYRVVLWSQDSGESLRREATKIFESIQKTDISGAKD